MADASAPASAANLGPGFDVLALALELRCRVEAETAPTWEIEHAGPERPGPGQPDRVLDGARLASNQPLALRVWSEIPLDRGLGSSAAAAGAGFAAALLATGRVLEPGDVFRAVARLEGHPDNAAAVAGGGLVAVDGAGGYARLQLHESLRAVVAVPDLPWATESARAILPDPLERAIVVRSLARLVGLVEGLRTADRDRLRTALGDELHERPRSELRPEVARLIETALEAGARYACWSGAGPSMLALGVGDEVEEVAAALSREGAFSGRVLTPAVARTGVR